MSQYRPAHILFALVLLSMLFGAGCVYDSDQLNAAKCSQEGQRNSDAICQNGFWVYDPLDEQLDAGDDASLDAAAPPIDANLPEDTGNDTSESDTDTGTPEIDIAEPEDTAIPEDDIAEPEDTAIPEEDTEEPEDTATPQPDTEEPDDPDAGLANTGYLQVAAGATHTCAINSDSHVVCWGTASAALLPQNLVGVSFSYIAVGRHHSCAIRTNNQKVECWGVNGTDTMNPGTDTFLSINLGETHACGITSNNKVYCWGADLSGSVANHPNSAGWTHVTAGEEHSCANKADGTFACWGTNSEERAIFNSTALFSSLAAAKTHTCAIKKTDNQVTCAGNSEVNNSAKIPTAEVLSIDARDNYSCVIKADETIYCWGAENNGRISEHPQTEAFSQISTGWEHACAITKTKGAIKCWGKSDTNIRYPVEFNLP